MLLTKRRGSYLAWTLLALGACGDFTLVDPLPSGPTLSINVQAVSDETTRFDLNAWFYPGKDARGRLNEVTDRALYVEGTPVLPEPNPTRDFWRYNWQGTRTAAHDPTSLVRVTFPVINGSSPPHSITIPVTYRAGPQEIDLLRGHDLVLPVSLGNRVTTGLSGGVEFWRLEIRQSCSSDLSQQSTSISGDGPHPSELRVPWQWVETLPAESIAACFQAFSTFDVAGSPYPVYVGVSARLEWLIRIVEPSG